MNTDDRQQQRGKVHRHTRKPENCDHIADRCCVECCEPGGVFERAAR